MHEPTSRGESAASHPLTRSRADVYARLMEAQELIAQDRYRGGVTDEQIESALDAVDERLADDARREDLYLAALAIYVEELGGTLELRAAFAGTTVALPAG